MTYNLAEKYCVRITCKSNLGSGVVLPGKDTFYVYTAAHCLGKTQPTISEVVIEKQVDYQSPFEVIEGLEIVEFDQKNDYALIKVAFNLEDKARYSYKLARGFLSQNPATFCGYQGIHSTQYRPYNSHILTVSDASAKFKITLDGIPSIRVVRMAITSLRASPEVVYLSGSTTPFSLSVY
jgi:hypothetical protein